MRTLKLSFLLTVLLSMVGANVFAHDIAVENDDGVTIYYNFINNNTELSVTYRGSSYQNDADRYVGSVIIPSSVTYDGTTYNVTSSGQYAFSYCGSLTSITIPNSITAIAKYAFYGCSGLTSVKIPDSVTSIGDYAFADCSGLTSINIPYGVKSIGRYAFWNCRNATSLTLPSTITKIEYATFSYCTSLGRINIPSNVTSIEDYAFNGCSNVTYVTLPASITNIGNNSLPQNAIRTSNNYITMTEYSVSSGSYAQLWVLNQGCATSNLSLVKSHVTTASSVEFTFYPIKENVNVSSFKVNEIPVDLNNYTLKMSNLNPGTEFEITLEIIANGRTFKFKDMYRDYLPVQSFHAMYTKYKTDALILTTLSPKVIKQGEVVVAAESNLDEEETNAGFEWRRTDWPDDFASSTGAAYVYNGTMEGYIRNLNTDKLWRYRPYYLSNSGKYFYGDWMGIDPTNTSYFEPTVHTYEQVEIDGNTALVKGYAMTGTDGVTVQGFMYWKSVAGAQSADATNRAVAIPSDAKTVEASGQVMTANLTGLDYSSTYHYVAFVKTTTGETFYGEERMFDTGADPTGISEVVIDKPATSDMVRKGIYTLSGVKVADDISELYSLPYGVYIVNGKKYNLSRNSRP